MKYIFKSPSITDITNIYAIEHDLTGTYMRVCVHIVYGVWLGQSGM